MSIFIIYEAGPATLSLPTVPGASSRGVKAVAEAGLTEAARRRRLGRRRLLARGDRRLRLLLRRKRERGAEGEEDDDATLAA